ncbi:MAG: hypothetical protein IKN87_03255 [Bacilli bacterium]|nr:hypothetical protein [Bacilli bacterium]
MSKYIKSLAVITLIVVLTGCGSSKKITCTVKTTDSSRGDAVSKATFYYNKDGSKIEKYVTESSQKYNDKYLEYSKEKIENIIREAEEECEDFKNYKIVTCNVTSKGNKITQTITYNLKELDEEKLKEMYDEKDINYSIYSKSKELLEKNYADLKKDISDSTNRLYIYGCK